MITSSGSSARLIARIASSAGAPCSAGRYFILPCPTPCSPVQVPSMASARSTSRSMKRLGARDLVGVVHVDQQRRRGNCRRRHGRRSARSACSRRCRAGSRSTHSASREIGTQTSVANALRAGPQRRAPPSRRRGAPARACVRSSGLRRPFERTAAEILRRSRRSARDCSATPASVPWNSRNSIGVSGSVELGIGDCSACTCSASSNSMRATGMPDWMVRMAALQAASTDGKRADAAGDRLRNAVRASASAR